MDIFRFRNFPVYRDIQDFRKRLKQFSRERFPKGEEYVLRSQLWRALDSMILNIAEGADKHSDKDFSHFLNTSLGSLNEVVGCLDCALEDGYMTSVEHGVFIQDAEKIARQLKAFLAKVRADDRRF